MAERPMSRHGHLVLALLLLDVHGQCFGSLLGCRTVVRSIVGSGRIFLLTILRAYYKHVRVTTGCMETGLYRFSSAV